MEGRDLLVVCVKFVEGFKVVFLEKVKRKLKRR